MNQKQIKTKDKELETRANEGLLPLMQFRWEQTLGEGGYTFSEYARIVGRDKTAIRQHATGYALWIDPKRDIDILTPLDALKLGSRSRPEQTAMIAAANAVGTTPAEVGQRRRPDVKVAKKAARKAVDEAVEQGADEKEQQQRGEEAAQQAVLRHKKETAAKTSGIDKGKPKGWAQLTGHADKGVHSAEAALEIAEGVEFPDDLTDSLINRAERAAGLWTLVARALRGESVHDEIEDYLAAHDE